MGGDGGEEEHSCTVCVRCAARCDRCAAKGCCQQGRPCRHCAQCCSSCASGCHRCCGGWRAWVWLFLWWCPLWWLYCHTRLRKHTSTLEAGAPEPAPRRSLLGRSHSSPSVRDTVERRPAPRRSATAGPGFAGVVTRDLSDLEVLGKQPFAKHRAGANPTS